MKRIRLEGFIDPWGYTRSDIARQLRDSGGGPVVLEVDSLGGDVHEALSISNMLGEHGNVTAHIVGFVASAATWLCYGCKSVRINSDCGFLIHKCATQVSVESMMTADQMSTMIEDLKNAKKSNEAVDLIIAGKYAGHSNGKMDVRQALKLMRENRWMTPTEALELGLVDEVVDKTSLSPANYARMASIVNYAGLPSLPSSLQQPEKKSIGAQLKEALIDFFGGSVLQVTGETKKVAAVDVALAPADVAGSAGTADSAVEDTTVEDAAGQEEGTATAVGEPADADTQTAEDSGTAAVHNQVAGIIGGSINYLDGCALLNEDQMTLLDAAIDASDALRAERDASVGEVDAAVQQLNALSDDVAALGTLGEKVAYVTNLLKRHSTSVPHPQLRGNGHNGVGSDPVNELAQCYRRKK